MKKSLVLDLAILIYGAAVMVRTVADPSLTSTHDTGTIARDGLQLTPGRH